MLTRGDSGAKKRIVLEMIGPMIWNIAVKRHPLFPCMKSAATHSQELKMEPV